LQCMIYIEVMQGTTGHRPEAHASPLLPGHRGLSPTAETAKPRLSSILYVQICGQAITITLKAN
jgi:hypothetical protein